MDSQTETTPSVTIEPPRAVIRNQPLVKVYVMKATCDDCDDLYDINNYLSALNDTIYMDVSYVTPEQIGILPVKLPALLFNETIVEYPSITKNWENSGSIVDSKRAPYVGKWYVFPVIHAPFYDTESELVRGRVGVTYLMMSPCKDCLTVPVLREQISNIGLTPYHEEIIDVRSERGKILVQKYNITAVPTVILDDQAALHSQLFPGWYVTGTVEKDGVLVLRKLDRMQVPYYDLKYNQLMTP